jgi:hypothetical protein
MATETARQFGEEARLVERHDAGCIGAALGPYERAAVVGERQDGKGASGREMLLGATVMRALMRDGGDDARLVIGPAIGFDARCLAGGRGAPVGGNEEGGLRFIACGRGDAGETRAKGISADARIALEPDVG